MEPLGIHSASSIHLPRQSEYPYHNKKQKTNKNKTKQNKKENFISIRDGSHDLLFSFSTNCHGGDDLHSRNDITSMVVHVLQTGPLQGLEFQGRLIVL